MAIDYPSCGQLNFNLDHFVYHGSQIHFPRLFYALLCLLCYMWILRNPALWILISPVYLWFGDVTSTCQACDPILFVLAVLLSSCLVLYPPFHSSNIILLLKTWVVMSSYSLLWENLNKNQYHKLNQIMVLVTPVDY